MRTLSVFEQESLRLAFSRMFRADKWFDICVIDTAVKLTGVVIPARTYDCLRMLHCVGWNTMTQKMREEAAKIVLDAFNGTNCFDLPQLENSFLPDEPQSHEAVKPSLFQKLLGKVS